MFDPGRPGNDVDAGLAQRLAQVGWRPAGRPGHEGDDIARVGAQEQRLLAGRLDVAEDADAPVHRLVAVADRAEPHSAGIDALAEALDRRRMVDQPGGQEHVARADLHVAAARDERVVVARQRRNLAVLHHGAIERGLLAQAAQQRGPADALEAGIVVALGDQRGAARAGIDNTRGAAEARQVDRGGEAGGPAANDETIEHAASCGVSRSDYNGPGARLFRRAPTVRELAVAWRRWMAGLLQDRKSVGEGQSV